MTDDPMLHREEAERELQRTGYQVRIMHGWEPSPGHIELVGAEAADDLVAFVDALVNPFLEIELGEPIGDSTLLPMIANEYFHIDGDAMDEPVQLSLDEADQSMVGAVLDAVGVDLQVRARLVEAAGQQVRLLHVEPMTPLPAMSQRLRDQAVRSLRQWMASFGA